jgi:DNA-binding winged helix-turn-helix (wHTH) protein
VTVLEDLDRTASDRIVSTVLATLFEETLAEWHRKQRVPSEGKSLAELYCKMLGLDGKEELREKLENSLAALVRRLPSVGADVHRDGSRLTIHFGVQSYSYVDPAIGIGRAFGEPEPTVLLKTPGVLNGSNILTDGKNRTWLTDFADAALAPTFWNFVSLESVVRFDRATAPRIEWYHEMEALLVGPEFSKLYASGVEPPLRGTVRTVQHIRRFAARLMPRQEHSYQIGIFFHAVKRLVDHRTASQVTSNELLRLGHLLFATAMLLERLTLKQGTRVPTSRKHSKVQIDQENRTVRINGVEVPLRGQAFDLLHELYLHANESCSRAKIVERIFGEKYEETNESQTSRLNTAIRRLREKIEDDPDDPQLLVTESGVGYKLIATRER